MPTALELPPRPDGLAVPTLRFWGDRKPPKNRAAMFSSSTIRNAAAGVDGAPSAASEESVATLRMYGPIDSWGGFWGISAKDVSEALDSLGDDVTEVRVRINSPGGEVWEGLAILNMLRAHPARIVAVVDGIAASAASFIAAGCDETVMSPGTQMMIHDASGFAFGPAAVMRKAAEFLDSASNSVASLYAEAAGGSLEQWRAAMVEETWYTAQEAVDAKLADRIAVVPDAGATTTSGAEEEDPFEGDAIEDRFDLSIFNYAGRANAPGPKPPAASADGSSNTTTEGGSAVAFTTEQMTDLRRKLGVAEDADETTILAALDESLSERAEAAPVTDPTIPEGHIVIPEARLRDLEANAQRGADAASSLQVKEREDFLDSVRTKFVPANRAAWAKEYDRDPDGTRKHFESTPDIIALVPAGHGQNDGADEDDVLFNKLFPTDKKEG
jgi:ATP-dependent protease ClpP protease subunit